MEELREMSELKNYHEYFRELLTIWKHTLGSKSSQLALEIVNCCLDEDHKETLSDQNTYNNNKNKEEFGKQILFWLSSCIARINEPYQILRELDMLQ